MTGCLDYRYEVIRHSRFHGRTATARLGKAGHQREAYDRGLHYYDGKMKLYKFSIGIINVSMGLVELLLRLLPAGATRDLSILAMHRTVSRSRVDGHGCRLILKLNSQKSSGTGSWFSCKRRASCRHILAPSFALSHHSHVHSRLPREKCGQDSLADLQFI